MSSLESQKFLKILGILALAWFGIGLFLCRRSDFDLSAFIQIFLYASLDLVFLILLFWKLFFTPAPQRGRTLQVLVFFTFKLVCLGFLAITLKRLRNASLTAIIMGVGFVFVGPFLAGVIKINRKGNERDTRI